MTWSSANSSSSSASVSGFASFVILSLSMIKSRGEEYTDLSDPGCYWEPIVKSAGGANCTLTVDVDSSDVIQVLSTDAILVQNLP